MLGFFYNGLLLLGVLTLWPLALIWLLRVPKVRAGLAQKLGAQPEAFRDAMGRLPTQQRIWVHVVSVGEFNAAWPLLKQLHEDGLPLVVTTTTATGQALAKSRLPETVPVGYFPLDFPSAVRSAFQTIQPRLVVIFETELWPNVIAEAKRRHCPLWIVNARLSERSFKRYQTMRWFFAPILRQVTRFMAQTQGDADRFKQLGAGARQVSVMGNVKFDMPEALDTAQADQLARRFHLAPETPLLVFASTHPGEEALCLAIYQALRPNYPQLRMLLAPRHPERGQAVEQLLEAQGETVCRRSILQPDTVPPDDSILVLDTIGELMAAFQLAQVVVIAGTFGKTGGHNPLEPMNVGVPVIFGPDMRNFKEIARQCLAEGAALQVSDAAGAIVAIEACLTEPEMTGTMITAGQHLLGRYRGATQHLYAAIREALGHG